MTQQREGMNKAEPTPEINDSTDVQTLVMRDLEARRRYGIEKYGTALQAHNGRNALLDLYQELLDATCYMRQLLAEQETGVDSYEPVARELAKIIAHATPYPELRKRLSPAALAVVEHAAERRVDEIRRDA